jgi:hypothetical protein
MQRATVGLHVIPFDKGTRKGPNSFYNNNAMGGKRSLAHMCTSMSPITGLKADNQSQQSISLMIPRTSHSCVKEHLPLKIMSPAWCAMQYNNHPSPPFKRSSEAH